MSAPGANIIFRYNDKAITVKKLDFNMKDKGRKPSFRSRKENSFRMDNKKTVRV